MTKRKPQAVTPESYLSGIPLCSVCGRDVVAGIRGAKTCINCYETRSISHYLDEEKEMEDDNG